MKILNGQVLDWRVPSAFYLVCCDCGLHHLMLLERGPKGRIRARVYRDDALTQQKRRERRHRQGLGGHRG